MAKKKKYGLPYMGSKSTIAEWITGLLPSATHLYDLFAGGCAVTHAALMSGKWEYIHANDINDTPRLFIDAVNGKYRDEKRWISRDDFFALKGSDAYVRTCWSFGNNGASYLYSTVIEPYKKACHYAVVLDDWGQFDELCPEVAQACKDALRGVSDIKQRRLAFGSAVVRWLKAYGNEQILDSNPLYSSCHTKKDTPTRKKGTIRDLERLQSLERLERLERLQRDYREVEFADDCVIYCDPPYQDSKERYYGVNFDYTAFYDWAAAQTKPLFISEYNVSDDRFVEYASTSKVCSMSSTTTKVKQERIYIPRHQRELIDELVNKQDLWDFK